MAHASPGLWSALAVALVSFALLWLCNMPYRQAYEPTDNDVTALADGLLLLPGARWEDWFGHGHAHFFDTYPEWPLNLTAFARPAFQFAIYLAHYVFDGNWASFLALNYLGVACVGAVAFAIARAVLRLGIAVSLLATALVLVSPAVLEFSIWQLGFASESIAAALVGTGFLAVVARRDLLCLLLLAFALLTKETVAWAPLAAAVTVLVRPGDGTPRRRMLGVAAMLLPLGMWAALRLAVFGGIGGTYATADFAPFSAFLNLAAWKLAHLHHLFVQQDVWAMAGPAALLDRALRIASAVFVFLLLFLWVLSGVRTAIGRLGVAVGARRRPSIDEAMLVTLWAVSGLVFQFAIALPSSRYAASAMMFAWPAIVAEVARRRGTMLHVGLAACFVLSATRTSHFLIELNPPPEQSEIGESFRAAAAMNATLRQVPPEFARVYVFSAGSLATTTPAYLAALLGMRAEIVRLVDIRWHCTDRNEFVAVDRDVADGVVSLSARLPECASFYFNLAGIDAGALSDGRLHRGDAITYELPEARPVDRNGPFEPALDLGQRIIIHIRTRGPARFIVEPGGPGGGLAWFDAP